jgi:nucleotide-binding universal stress UspA family protein
MFENIVVGTDGSETASEAVRQAAELAAACGAQLHVVTAYTATPALASVAVASAGQAAIPIDVASLAGDVRAEAERLLDRAADAASSRGAATRCHARAGNPADVLVEIAQEERADLLVVGNRGMAGARRLLGSVPNRVSHHAPCTVMIVQTATSRGER